MYRLPGDVRFVERDARRLRERASGARADRGQRRRAGGFPNGAARHVRCAAASGGQAHSRRVVVEVVTDVSDDLPVRRVARALDAHHVARDLGRVVLRIPEQVELCHGRAQQEDRLGTGEEREDLVKEVRLVGRVIARFRQLFLGMAVDVVSRRVHRLFVERRAVDVEDARLIVIDPDRLVSHERSALHGECRA